MNNTIGFFPNEGLKVLYGVLERLYEQAKCRIVSSDNFNTLVIENKP
jgi:hypothetical protein